MKVLFITPYPFDSAPSQRFRFEQYFDLLKQHDICYIQKPFLSHNTWKILYTQGKYVRKFFGILSGFFKRFLLLFSINQFDFVFIHREASPIGPPMFEWIITKICGAKIVYDFDDSIWLPNTSGSNWLVGGLKWHHKVGSICRWSHKVSCGNQFLVDFAKKHNPNVQLNPTTIDTKNYHNKIKDQQTDKVVIGWTGSHSTMKYLDSVPNLIKEIESEHNIEFVVISDLEPKLKLKSLQFIKWNKESEVEDLLKINIGIMPLTDDDWSRGKCGFKALQYMSLGIPAIASPVGVNKEIIDNNINGFLCEKEGDWKRALKILITDNERRNEMGLKARERIIENYSVSSNSPNFLSLFK